MGSPIISADSHVDFPTDLYTHRIPERFRHRAPRVEMRGSEKYLLVDGRKPKRLDVADSRLTDEDREREFRDGSDGGRNIQLRIAAQDRDGVNENVDPTIAASATLMILLTFAGLLVGRAWDARVATRSGARLGGAAARP